MTIKAQIGVEMDDDRVLSEMAGELRIVVEDEGIDPDDIPDELISTVDLYQKRGGEKDYTNEEFQQALIARVIRMGNG